MRQGVLMRWVVTLLVLVSIARAGKAQVAPAPVWELDPTQGTTVHRGILGHTWEFQLQSPLKAHATLMRGVAGGLAAENFDWRVVAKQRSGAKWSSTLQFLRDCRDNKWEPLVTANLRGLTDPNRSGQFGNTDPEMLAQLAADWVRYCNHIVHTYRQGDEITDPQDKRILESIDWPGEDVLLAPNEAAVPNVTYWEIGNEPSAFAGNLPNGAGPHVFTHRPDDYVLRYQTITRAMVKADPTIKVGPCFADDFRDLKGKPFVMAVLRSDARIDFLSYHKYAHLMHGWPDEGTMLNVLHGLRQEMDDRHVRCIAAIRESGRDPASIELALTEYNAASWGVNSVQSSMARAIGTAIYMHNLIDHGYRMANHWDRLAFNKAPWPAAVLMTRYVRDLGTLRTGRYRDDAVDLIATRAPGQTDALMIWGYNLDPRSERRVRLKILGQTAKSVDISTLGPVTGNPSLLSRNTPVEPAAVSWSEPRSVSVGAGGEIELHIPPLSVTQWRVDVELGAARVMQQVFDAPGQAAPGGDSGVVAASSGVIDLSLAARELRATVESGSTRLAWQIGSRHVATQSVERCDDDIEFNTIKDLDASATTWLDTSVQPGATYQYRIVTRTADGATAYSSGVEVTIPGTATTRPAETIKGVVLTQAKLLAHWPFDQESGLQNLITPGAGSEAIGKAAIATVDGREALKIEKGSYVRLDDPPAFPIGPGFEGTITLWLRTNDHRGVVLARNESHDAPAAYEYGIMLDPPGRVRWMSAVHVRSFKSLIGTTAASIADGNWRHVAIVFQNTTARFYIDGAPAGEFNSLEHNVPLRHSLLIGANRTWRPDLINPGITMAIADLRLYDRALSANAVKELTAK